MNIVKERLNLVPNFPIISVAGTNGKGSTCALLEAIYCKAGYRVGCYTSPHLLRYTERIRINAIEVTPENLCQAFAQVEAARGNTALTYFEFGTLAAMLLFIAADPEIVILEVGMGGRLDATNVFDNECAIITSIDLDHMHYLGSTREEIGFEKAGIFRCAQPAIYAEIDMPHSVRQHAQAIETRLLHLGSSFGFIPHATHWDYWSTSAKRAGLPYPALRGHYQLNNASAALMAVEQLATRLPVSMQALRSALVEVELPGRFQVFPGRPAVILDVAHNPHAARALATTLDQMQSHGKTFAVLAMLEDKDINGVIAALEHRIDVWLVAGLSVARGAPALSLIQELQSRGITQSTLAFDDPAAAYVYACGQASENDRIVVFGSFYTVAAVMHHRESAVIAN